VSHCAWIFLSFFSYEHGTEFPNIFDLQAEGMRANCASAHVRAAFHIMLDIGRLFPIKRVLLWKRARASDEKGR